MNEKTNDAPKRELTFTELAKENERLTRQLSDHTESRNYLYAIAVGDALLPELTIGHVQGKPAPDISLGSPLNFKLPHAEIDMNTLPSDIADSIIAMALAHEEDMAFELWRELADNATRACQLIEKIRNARYGEEVSKAKNAAEAPDTDDFLRGDPEPQKGNLNESQEVPTGRPNKSGTNRLGPRQQ